MTDFGQFQEPFAEVPLEPVEPQPDEGAEENNGTWWVDEEDEDE